MEKRLVVRLDPQIFLRFKVLTTLKGLNMSDVIRQLIENWLRENEPARQE
ncbi:MAG: hypothetical protein FJ014_13245 [Chloroflexi bacterium]|nr:hypothetical protein [Chloroflexota bacterium]